MKIKKQGRFNFLIDKKIFQNIVTFMLKVLYVFCFYCCLVYSQQPDLEEITQWVETQNNAENPPEFVLLEWFNDVRKDNRNPRVEPVVLFASHQIETCA